jgi:hypothetical protein
MPKNRYPMIYGLWIAICAILFLALSGVRDRSRPNGRILSNDAGKMAEQVLLRSGRTYRGYHVVHIADPERGDADPRFIVLLDSEPRSALSQAVVVELRARDGALVRMRKPVE